MKPVHFSEFFARDVENLKHCPVKYYDAKYIVLFWFLRKNDFYDFAC